MSSSSISPDLADRTGRDSLERNVVFSWGSHLVFLVVGFLLPRAIDTNLGQSALGIWDFCWSIVGYLTLSTLSVGTSVNRYVARYRASGETDKLNSTLSSVSAIQIASALLIVVLTVSIAYVLPIFFAERLGNDASTAAVVALLLGLSIAVQVGADCYKGVISGCHRWDIHNGLNAIGYGIAATLMMLVLRAGYQLEAIAGVYLTYTIVVEIIRIRIAKAICPELQIRLSSANLSDTKKVFKFGIKIVVMGLPKLLVLQTSNILLVASLGPSALAVFSRPIALINHMLAFINKFTFVLGPTTGAMQVSKSKDELRSFTLQTARATWSLAVPAILFFVIYGDLIMKLWMGDDYVNQTLIIFLGFGALLPMSQRSMIQIIISLDEHGSIAKMALPISLLTIGVGILLAVYSDYSLIVAALIVSIPSAISMGLWPLMLGCRLLNISALEYIRVGMRGVFTLAVALAAVGILARTRLESESTLVSLSIGALLFAVVFSLLHLKEIQVNALRLFGRKA